MAVVAAITALGLAVMAVAPAGAQTYGSSGITLSKDHPAPGDSDVIVAMGFKPGSTVTDSIASNPLVLGTAAADANGTAQLTATIPMTMLSGSTHQISASGVAADGSPLTESVTVTLGTAASNSSPPSSSSSSSPSSSSSSLAFTGVRLAALGGVSLAVGALGVFMVFVTRRRRRRV